ncbi:restriction endonuclease subunit S [Marinobacter sp. F4218]|uniref:restriction endonuclease subunit S n=1 Tax=Marinobacter sp. F4218 TaxID=2862868 RepID=UPI001C637B1D|nr:restriction endonuclease subunit S [Marinobacter sp. F4218]MBW7471155.1 restriction endonuclease subunit S [Marinobacter sp. F4218]
MPAKWVEYSLGDLCAEITVGHVGSMTNEYRDSGIPFFRSKNIREYRIDWDDVKYISQSFHEKLKKSTLRPGDVAVVRTGKPGTACVIPDYIDEANCSDLVIMRVNPQLLSAYFLSYYLNSVANHQINSQLVGAVQQHFNVGAAKKLSIIIPDRNEQERIVKVVKDLDDKIQLNHQINQTLEQIAQAIFKSWFVDFEPVIAKIAALEAGGSDDDALLAAMQAISGKEEAQLAHLHTEQPEYYTELRATAELFPSAMQDGESGEIPEGWKPSTVGQEFDVTMGQSPPGDTYNEAGDGAPFFQGRRDFGERFPSNRVYCTAPKRLANEADTLLSVRAPVGDTNVALTDCCIGRGLAALRHKSGCSSFTYYSVIQLGHELSSFDSEGTVFGSINQKNLKAIPVVAPTREALSAFKRAVGGIDELIRVNSEEAESLTAARDTLLPKLLSGELTITDSEDQITEAKEAADV